MKKLIMIILGAVVLALSGCATPAPSSGGTTTQSVLTVGPNVSANQAFTGQRLNSQNVEFLDFTREDFEVALAQDKTIVLNFYATWCPSCRKENAEAIAALDTLESENLVVFRVNYRDPSTDDFEESLAREFGVSSQGTKVIIQNGERVAKTPAHWSRDEYITELSKY